MAILGMAIMFFISNQNTFAQEQRPCIINQICVMPHDYLKYEYNGNLTRTITFGDFIDSSMIKVSNMANDGKSITTINYILNLKNGTLIDSNGTHSEFYFMMPIPIDSKKIDISYVNESINFNGFNRDTFGMHIHNTTHIINSNIDKKTGIKMNYDARLSLASFGKNLWLSYYLKLVDTNMIASSTSSSIPQSVVPEFGTLVGMITAVSTISVIIVSKIKN